jgi:hypothetical protein
MAEKPRIGPRKLLSDLFGAPLIPPGQHRGLGVPYKERRRAINMTPNPDLTVSERRAAQSFRSARAERALLASPAATAGAVLPQLLRI